jgi:hypothetical protein
VPRKLQLLGERTRVRIEKHVCYKYSTTTYQCAYEYNACYCVTVGVLRKVHRHITGDQRKKPNL